jgi:hypothetical protein
MRENGGKAGTRERETLRFNLRGRESVLINAVHYWTVVGQLRVLQERAPNTLEPFRTLYSTAKNKMLQPLMWWFLLRFRVSAWKPGQETDAFPLLPSSRLTVASELKRSP